MSYNKPNNHQILSNWISVVHCVGKIHTFPFTFKDGRNASVEYFQIPYRYYGRYLISYSWTVYCDDKIVSYGMIYDETELYNHLYQKIIEHD